MVGVRPGRLLTTPARKRRAPFRAARPRCPLLPEYALLSAKPSRARTWAALSICVAGYLYAFPYQERVNNPNENVRLYMTAALVEDGTYMLDRLRREWGYVNDCGVRDGHIYSVKAPATSFLGVPPYAAYYWLTESTDVAFDRTTALWVCRVFASILPWLLFLFFFHRFLGRHTSSALARDAVFFSVALGSCLYGYGMLFLSHTLSAAAAFGAFMLLFDARHAGRISRGRAWLAGLLTAGVTLFEYPGLVASVALTVYAVFVIRRVSRLIPFGLGALVPTLAMMHFQWRCFGSPFSPGHLYVETPAFRELHEEGFFGAVGVQWEAVYGLLVDPGAGLFTLTPILVFGAFGLGVLVARRWSRADGLLLLALVGLTTAGISVLVNWRGGWTIGPRYLAVVYPFLGWAALFALEPLIRRAPRVSAAIVVGTLFVGFALSGATSVYYPHYPEAIDRPLTQVVRLLVAHDFAPRNAGAFADVYGTASMLPLLALAALALAFVACAEQGWLRRALALVSGLCVGLALSWPLAFDPRPGDPAVRDAVAYITRFWDPAGHDRAARLAAALREDADPAGFRRLADLYDREGRTREASTARARAARLER